MSAWVFLRVVEVFRIRVLATTNSEKRKTLRIRRLVPYLCPVVSDIVKSSNISANFILWRFRSGFQNVIVPLWFVAMIQPRTLQALMIWTCTNKSGSRRLPVIVRQCVVENAWSPAGKSLVIFYDSIVITFFYYIDNPCSHENVLFFW